MFADSLIVKMSFHIASIYMAFLLCEYACAFLSLLIVQMPFHIQNICKAFHQYDSLCVVVDQSISQRLGHIGRICMEIHLKGSKTRNYPLGVHTSYHCNDYHNICAAIVQWFLSSTTNQENWVYIHSYAL